MATAGPPGVRRKIMKTVIVTSKIVGIVASNRLMRNATI
jgi:hypothetical protein